MLVLAAAIEFIYRTATGREILPFYRHSENKSV
jgi:hypothetical protein